MRVAESRVAATAIGVLSLASSLFYVGCRASKAPTTVAYGGIGWKSAEEQTSVPGIDHAMVGWYIRGHDVVYVVWTDLVGGGGSSWGGGGSSSGTAERNREHLNSSDGQHLEFEYELDQHETGFANSGVIVIGDARCDLKDGSLVLVSTRGDHIQVKQLDMDASVRQLLRDESQTDTSIRAAFRAIAKDSVAIRIFFEKAARVE